MSGYSLKINGSEVELLNDPEVILTYDAALTRSIDAVREDQYIDFEVCSTLAALPIFGGEGYLHIASRFNATENYAELDYEGVLLYEGAITMRGVERVDDGVTYHMRITRSGAEWANAAADTLVSDTLIEYQLTLRNEDLKAEWGSVQPVQFFPVIRDEYPESNSSVSVETVRQLLSIDDYHPFLRLAPLVDSIAEVGGYEVESQFWSSDEGQSLYMSGSYASQENAAVKEVMDFRVEKLTDESSTADYMGRVSIVGLQSSSIIATIVDIDSLDEDSDCYSRSSCLTYVDGAVQFTPTTEVSVGFEYRLKYTTEYQIESRDTLMGFDTFYFGESPEIKVEIANLFPDERGEEILTGFTYLIMVFDHQTNASYRLRGRLTGSSSYTTLTSWSGRTQSYTTPYISTIAEVILEVASGSDYVEYSEDWALYQGYITEWGETEIDVTIRVSPDTLSPTSPKRFEAMYVQGAESGMTFGLLAGTTITPYFAEFPGYGDVVDYQDLSQHEISQGLIFESLQHLFNLRYYGDPKAQKLYIEPLESFYDRSVVWDWSDRILPERGVTYEDCAVDISRERLWGFQLGDGAISRSSSEFGEWSYTLENYASQDQSTSLLNPIFSPSLNDDDGVLMVGDRDDESLAGSLEFSPRVVYCRGLDDSGVPIVVFHSAEEGVSLCFEDRDELVGLNQHYLSQIEREERSQYVTLWLSLEPHEVVDLYSPLEGRASLFSTFGLQIDGEWCEAWIERIDEYRVGGGVAKVTFVLL